MSETLETPAPVEGQTDRQAERQTKHFPSSSGSRFAGYFASGKRSGYKKTDLLDARARRLFETTALACRVDAYPFQVPLQSKSGPWVQADGHSMLLLSSYDYLGLIGDPRIDGAAVDAVRKYGTGTGGARLLTGTMDLHSDTEREFAAFRGVETMLTLGSGYMANIAVLYALFGPADRVIADTLCHRSVMDACRMAGVQVQRFRHNDMASLREELEKQTPANRTLIITDGVFSMDGDICRLPEIIELKKEFGCFLLVDEAHALGVLGETGRGTDEHFGIFGTKDVDLWTGSLAKAVPATGGYIGCSEEVAIFLQHAAAPFVFSAALCPASVAATREGIRILGQEPERVHRLKRNADFMREGLRSLGYDVGLSETAVIPVIFNSDEATALFARALRDYNLLVAPVLFPAVPQGTARLRLCVTAAHTQNDLEFALDAFGKLARN